MDALNGRALTDLANQALFDGAASLKPTASAPALDAREASAHNRSAREHSVPESAPAAALAEAVATCKQCVDMLRALDEHYRTISARTSALHSTVQTLSSEASRVKTLIDKLAVPLAAFHSLYIIGTRVSVRFEGAEASEATAAWALAVRLADTTGNPHRVALAHAPIRPLDTPGEFAAALDRIDECVTYLAGHIAFTDAPAFLSRYRQLQQRLLHDLRSAVADSVGSTVSAAMSELREVLASPGGAALTDTVEMSLLHVRFRTELPHVRRLMALTEARAGKRVYAEAAKECYVAYCDARVRLLRALCGHKVDRIIAGARASMHAIAVEAVPTGSTGPLPAAAAQRVTRCVLDTVRAAAAMLSRMINNEYALFLALFLPPLDGASSPTISPPSTPLPSARRGESDVVTAGGVPSHLRAAADAACNAMLEEACASMDALRPLLMTAEAATLDTQCDVVHVLRDEVLGELAGTRGAAMSPLVPAATALLRDVQERIAFLAESYIAERLQAFQPCRVPRAQRVRVGITAADGAHAVVTSVTVHHDMDYPTWLVAYYLNARSTATGAAAGTPTAAAPPSMYESWFPAVEATLALLSKLYRVVEPATFDALAQDAVAACTTVLLRARGGVDAAAAAAPAPLASRITIEADATSPDSSSTAAASHALVDAVLGRGLLAGAVDVSPAVSRAFAAAETSSSDTAAAVAVAACLDGDLFVIKNLLVLREQLSPFDVHATSAAKTLDFTSTTQALSTLVGQAAHVFSLSKSNPLLSFVTTGLPTVSERRVDCKAELEALLKSSCERLIANCRALLATQMERSVSNARRVVAECAEAATAAVAPASVSPALHDAMNNMLATTRASSLLWSRLLVLIRRRLGLYMGSAVTATILFRPVREHLLNLTHDARRAYLELRALGAAAEGGDAWHEAAFTGMARVLEGSDQIVVEPMNIAYGYDDAAMPSPLAGHRSPALSLDATAAAAVAAAAAPVTTVAAENDAAIGDAEQQQVKI